MRVRFFFVVFFTCCCAAYAQSPQAHPVTAGGESEAVHKAVEEVVEALDRNDADALDRLSTPDYIFVNPAGRVWNKAEYLELIRSGTLKVDSYTRAEEIIRLYGDTAVVIYRSSPKGTFKGQELTSDRRVTTVLVKQGGRWLATGRQSTPILERK
jgi:ketosteroid isomerase-like protein